MAASASFSCPANGARPGRSRLSGLLVDALTAKDMLVSAPVMPWSRDRDYDVDYPAALEQIGREVQRLREQGATILVVAGQSLGANAAIAYAAAGPVPVDAIVVISPGHVIELPPLTEQLGASVAKARAMVAEGKGEARSSFEDVNQGRRKSVSTSARNYLSYFDPEGLGAMSRTARSFPRPVAVLWVVGTRRHARRAPVCLQPHARASAKQVRRRRWRPFQHPARRALRNHILDRVAAKMTVRLLIAVIALAVVLPAFAQERKIPLVDEAASDASWVRFKKRLQAAIEKRDRQFLLSILDRNVRNQTEQTRGIAEFRKQWELDTPGSPVWRELATALQLGSVSYARPEKRAGALRTAPVLGEMA